MGDQQSSLAAMFQASPVGLALIDSDWRVVELNDTFAAALRLPAEPVGKRVPDLLPESWSELEPVYRKVLEGEHVVVHRRLLRTSPDSGDPVRGVWLIQHHPVSVDGRITGIGVVAVDISEQRLVEEIHSTVMDNMVEGLIVVDQNCRVLLMNAAAERMVGRSGHELEGLTLADLIREHAPGASLDSDGLREAAAAVREGNPVRGLDDTLTRPDGTSVPIAYSVSPLHSGHAMRGAVIVFRDVSTERAEQSRLQRELDELSWVGRIKDALEEGRLRLHAQPIVPLREGEPAEELLLRMVGRAGEEISPCAFLPAAEKYGLIADIDRWVVTQAVGLAATGRRVSVNLSARSVGNADLLALIERHLRDTGADPHLLVFEITETAVMLDLDAADAFVRRLTDLGCDVALDDFGTGFGSFATIKRLPIKYLKIDVEFVRQLGSSSANQHLVKAIVNLAQGFGQQTIAEGVEDEETLELLRSFGVDHAQGFHLGRPAPVALRPQRELGGDKIDPPKNVLLRD